MKSRFLMTVALASLLGGSLYAYGGNMPNQNGGMMGGKPMMMKHGKHFHNHGVMGLLHQLNLSPTQVADIVKIKQEMMKNRVRTSEAFSKSGFDKDKYLKLKRQQRDYMLKSKAEMIDKVYKVLTSKQKEQLKVLMDLREGRMLSMMDKRMNFDKNCYGRR